MHVFEHQYSSDSSIENLQSDTDEPDYDDLQPRKKRRISRNPKEEAALGVFGSESEEDVSGKRWKGKPHLRKKEVNFVSSKDHQRSCDERDDDMDTEFHDIFKPSITGLNQNSVGSKNISPSQKKANNLSNSSEEIPFGRINSLATPNKWRSPLDASSRISSQTPKQEHNPRRNTSKNDPKSFAARMMSKMGYKEGEGLGKDGQGRSNVIEVTLRPQGVGLGAVKEKPDQEYEEEKRQAKIRGEEYIDPRDHVKKKKTIRAKSSQIRDRDNQKQSQKQKFRTLDEIKRLAPGLDIPQSYISILDMTAPNQKLIVSTSGIMNPETPSENTQHSELRKIVKRAKNDLSAYVEEWKNLEERKAFIKLSISEKRQEIQDDQRRYDIMQLSLTKFQPLSHPETEIEWDQIIQTLENVASEIRSELPSRAEDISKAAVAIVHPFVRRAAEGWIPLDDPGLSGFALHLSKIRNILELNPHEADPVDSNVSFIDVRSRKVHNKSSTFYESMIFKLIYPKILYTIDQNWDVHDPTPLLALLEVWQGLLPRFVKMQILNEAVVRKLNTAVTSWNPKKRKMNELPHLWLFPWLQYLPAHHSDPKSPDGLVSDIKRKFRHLVDSWDFNRGVVPGLHQWREVLYTSSKNDQWTPLIMNHVLPSMSNFLKNEKNFMVDPNDQEPFMSSLEGIFAWQDIISPRVIAQVLVDTIFPLWHNVLYKWLVVVGPNEEIGQWFEWWRHEVFPAEILNTNLIQNQFEKGHEMIKRALDHGPNALTPLPIPSSPKKYLDFSPLPDVPSSIQEIDDNSLRSRIENWCIENDLQFLAEKKILHDVGPLHRITAAGNGKNGALVYIKGDKIQAISNIGSKQIEINIDWESSDSKDLLLGMAWNNVK